MSHFLKTTVVGGAFFLVPFVLIIVILGYALHYTAIVAAPISSGLVWIKWASGWGSAQRP